MDYASCWLTNDELNIYFIQWPLYKLLHAKRDSINQDFSTPTEVTLNGIGPDSGNFLNSMGSPSFSFDMNFLFLYIMETVYINNYPAYIYEGVYGFKKTGYDNYTIIDSALFVDNISIWHGNLTSDNLEYYASIGKIGFFEKKSVSKNFDKFYFLNNSLINNKKVSNRTPYYSKENKILLFARDEWPRSKLYICYNFETISNTQANIAKDDKIKIIQNPLTNQEINIRFSLASYSHINLKLYNLLGQELYNYTTKYAKGTNNLKLNLKDLKSDIYFIRILINDQLIIKKILLI